MWARRIFVSVVVCAMLASSFGVAAGSQRSDATAYSEIGDTIQKAGTRRPDLHGVDTIDGSNPGSRIDSRLGDMIERDPFGVVEVSIVTDRPDFVWKFIGNHETVPLSRPTARPSDVIVEIPAYLAKKISSLDGVHWVSEHVLPTPVDSHDLFSASERFSQAGNGQPPVSPQMRRVVEIQGAVEAWNNGFDGDGVNVAVLDTGVDFGHPDLYGTQARVTNASSPYYGWPIAFDSRSMRNYLSTGAGYPSGNNWYSDTSSVDSDGNMDGVLDGTGYVVSGISSASGTYHYGLHPDDSLRIYQGYATNAPVLLVDSTTPWVYDTVYVDLDYDGSFSDEKPVTKGDEISVRDVTGDGKPDLSGGMIYFIADSVTSIPYADILSTYIGVSNIIPGNGDLVAFMINDVREAAGSHGTLCASAIAGQGIASSGLVSGTARGAKIVAVGNVYQGGSMYDGFYFAVEGYDGIPETGDEAQILSNSFGYSNVINQGWSYEARLVDWISNFYAPNATFVVASGNGGFGYGTVVSPGSSPGVVTPGAATSFWWESSFSTFGNTISWSDRGPNALGQVDPDVLSVGAYAYGSVPVNSRSPPNGDNAIGLWGGTSLATPVTAGIVAVLYDAFDQGHGQFPSSQLAKNILMASADNLDYDPFVQGAGLANASRASLLASEREGIYISPPHWSAGDFGGVRYEAFANLMHPGETDTFQFDIRNVDPLNSTTVLLDDVVLKKTFGYSQTVFRSLSDDSANGWTIDELIPLIDNKNGIYQIPDTTSLLVVKLNWDYFDFDRNWDYGTNNVFYLYAYDWMDFDNDSLYWDDVNSNGIIDSGEIESNPASEIVTINSATQTGDILELRIQNPSQRIRDGLILGIGRRVSGVTQNDVTLNLTIAAYEYQDCDWLSLDQSLVLLGPGESATFNATASIDTDFPIGAFQASIVASYGGFESVVPVTVNVAPNTKSFSFGGTPQDDDLYQNDRVIGGFNWRWRYESGDWRFYFIEGVDPFLASPGEKMFVNISWEDAPTDIDVFLLGNATDEFSDSNPERYGPYSMTVKNTGSSVYVGGGRFQYSTTTGDPYELIAMDLERGLNEIILHNVLNDGSGPWNKIRGDVGILAVTPYPWDLGTLTDFALLNGNQTFTIDSTVNFTGVTISAFGVSEPWDYPSQQIFQDNPSDPTSSSWQQEFFVTDGGYIKGVVDSQVQGLDIDLYLFFDSNGNGMPDSPGEIVASSFTYTAHEEILYTFPADGRYWLMVHGWSVPGGLSLFDGYFEVVQGTDLAVSDIPAGPIGSGAKEYFNGSYSLPSSEGDYIGAIFLGPRNDPDAIMIPFHVEILDASPAFYNHRPSPNSTISDNSPTIGVDFLDMGSGVNISTLRMTVDGIDVTGWSVVTTSSIDWPMPFLLAEGPHSVSVNLADFSGNQNATNWSFVVDTIPPLLKVYTPQEGMITNNPMLQVTGKTEPDASLLVQSAPATVQPSGDFDTTVSLVEGPNLITVQAFDLALNERVVMRNVTLDTIPPPLTIFQPANNSVTNTVTQAFQGLTEPGASVEISGTILNVQPDGTFSTNIALMEGQNLVPVKAIDPAGNERTEVINITLDTVAPFLTVTSPNDGLITNAASVDVSGEVEIGSVLRIDGVPRSVNPDGTFTESISLSLGDNDIIVDATDQAGNSAAIVLRVHYDPIPPALQVLSPTNGTTVALPTVTVSGTTEPGATLSVNGILALVSGTGDFSVDISLFEGANWIDVSSLDEAGNENRTVLLVILDTNAPSLVVLSPEDGLYTNSDPISVEGQTEPGAVVEVNGLPVSPQPDGSFQTSVGLTEGENIVSVLARDSAGNEVSEERTVVFDTVAPELEITSPSDGTITRYPSILVQGTTDFDAVLFIGDVSTNPRSNGSFESVIGLSEGDNVIPVESFDRAGNSASTVIQVTVDTQDPHAAAGEDIMTMQFDEVALSASTSSDNLGIQSFTWTFVDTRNVVNLSGEVAPYTFQEVGTYEVLLSVVDLAGNVDEDVLIVHVSPEGDSDNDGLQDDWEEENFEDLDESGADDPDGDRFLNTQEEDAGTDPNNSDTDGDGIIDGLDPDPLVPSLEKEGQLWDYWWIVAILAILLVVLLLYLRFPRRTTPEEVESSDSEGTEPDED
ncbi:MAG: S8 family serine peptidase [Thermoplasmata archaeon]